MYLRRYSPLVLILAVMAIFACQCVYFYPHLPERMATHFGPDGQPNGWMPKATFVITYGMTLFFVLLSCSGTAFLFRVVPSELINLPNKDYWLAPERKASTLATLEPYMLSMSAATGALMICIAQATFKANLTPDPSLGSGPWALLAVYLIFTLLWTVSLLRAFQKPAA